MMLIRWQHKWMELSRMRLNNLCKVGSSKQSDNTRPNRKVGEWFGWDKAPSVSTCITYGTSISFSIVTTIKQYNHLGNNETTVVQGMAQLLSWHDQRSQEKHLQVGEWSDAAYTGYQTKQFY